MNVLICHERFIFRFGADRVLILLGRGLSALGHKVAFMGNRYDRKTLESFASEVIDCPSEGDGLNLNECTCNWLESNWSRLFRRDNRPDVVVVGGWPFISAISFFRKVCPCVLFIDFGVVPDDGYHKEMINVLATLRGLRKQHLSDASLIVAISQFIAESQSRPDSKGAASVRAVLLGADHLEPSGVLAQFRSGTPDGGALDAMHSLKLQGKKIILSLGRWEPGCYKNSQAALEIVERLNAQSDCILVVLEQPSNIEIPERIKHAVLPVGFPNDQEMIEIMKLSDLGLSLSFWEGFNLPLAEMQWLDRPALAFAVGAHPEVVIDPWYLCRDAVEMTEKAAQLLHGTSVEWPIRAESREAFRSHFRWNRFIAEYSEILNQLVMHQSGTLCTQSLFKAALSETAPPNGSLSNEWKHVLYPGCLCENWQMNDSERLALTGVLARHQPRCSIEVGTYHAGSLSLISQYSKMVFSIDIDETIPSRFNFNNVAFITGRSHEILPYLLTELDNADVPVEFMLIDGDHSATGVKNDISCLLAYVPKRPLFVALHDSFNPECRRGMLEAGWDRSPYCHWVDIDFVPGKLAGRELWGGLALAYFLPIARSGDLPVNRAAEEMFQVVTARERS